MDQEALARLAARLMAKTHVKKDAVVKVMLAHQGLELAVIDGEWHMVCECDHTALLKDRGDAEQSLWHAKHIVDVMREKGMLK